MQTAYGRFLGEDALFCGVNAINGPGGNTHRTPYGGRAAEYCSEDSIISYYTGSNVIGAMADKGLIGSYKHFFLNEQEYDRQGIATFSNEQAIREIYLRAFEGSVTSTECHGIMTSYNRLGTTYMAANPAVQFSLLRDEWGFKGYLITDYIFEGVYAVTADMMINGSNVFGGNDRSKSLTALINDNNDGDMLLKAQESAHHILWAYTNSSMANVLAPETTYNDFTAWWQYVITAIQVVLGIVTACVVLLYVKSLYFGKGKRSGGKQQ